MSRDKAVEAAAKELINQIGPQNMDFSVIARAMLDAASAAKGGAAVATLHFDEECEACVNLHEDAIEALNPTPGQSFALYASPFRSIHGNRYLVTRKMEEAGRAVASTQNSTFADIFEAMLTAAPDARAAHNPSAEADGTKPS